MGKIKKISSAKIRKLTGGKDPVRFVEEFMIRRGFDPEQCLQQRTLENIQWLVPLSQDEELEITLDKLNRTQDCSLYMGVNVLSVELRDFNKFLTACLIVADKLVGTKLSLVNYDLVISVSEYASTINADDIDYFYELITKQKSTVTEAVLDDLENG